jgi:DNA-binding winged helix-turn-helix (wHTH) protein
MLLSLAGDRSMNNWVISFGTFRLTKSRRLLEKDGEPVRVGSRAFDILTYLLEYPGQVISHMRLISAAWPKTTVHEGNLRFQITALRKVLGCGKTNCNYIVNVPGRGYCFTAPISRREETSIFSNLAGSSVTRPNVHSSIPVPLIGHVDTIDEIKRRVVSHCIFSVITTDSVGKTSIAVVRPLIKQFCENDSLLKFDPAEDPWYEYGHLISE